MGRALGKLTAPDDLPDRIAAEGFAWLPIITADRHFGQFGVQVHW